MEEVHNTKASIIEIRFEAFGDKYDVWGTYIVPEGPTERSEKIEGESAAVAAARPLRRPQLCWRPQLRL